MRGKILIVDDDQSFCEMVQKSLGRHDIDAIWRTSPTEAFNLVTDTDDLDVVMVDLIMPELNGIDLCSRIVANRPDVPVIAVTAFGSMEVAVDAIRAGVYDFVAKPVDLQLLQLSLERAMKHRALQAELQLLHNAERPTQFDRLLGGSAPMHRLYEQIALASQTDATVLITGESGTGKELVARALHKRGPRKDGPFVAINCPALPETLLESELFGHVKGAFTDARANRKGIFLQANRGTVFLDEIGDLPNTLQPKLLRALEERMVRLVGGNEDIPFDARVITATNRDLESAIDDGRFREDLFFRVNVIQVHVPPLRTRGGDILLLTKHFVEHFAKQMNKQVSGFTDGVGEKLMDYTWPGNVRELRNAVERAVALTRFNQIIVEDLPERIRAYQKTEIVLASDNFTELVPMEEIERRYIHHVLQSVNQNKTQAARILGLDRKTLYRKLERYGASTQE